LSTCHSSLIRFHGSKNEKENAFVMTNAISH
jgi:hypothetical protein